MTTYTGWHFLADRGTLRDGTKPPPDGEWLEHAGPLVMCERGLHWSTSALDALTYAPGALVCRVEATGTTIHESDKSVSTRRRILWRADATDTLRAYARWCALQVIHLWDAPAVVLEYLETGYETKRSAALSVARSVARSAARSVARDAAWSAADAARSAAWSAARSAADAAANAAADAARDAAADAAEWAWDTVWAAMCVMQRHRLHNMLMRLAPGVKRWT